MSVTCCKASYWTSNGMPCCMYEVLVDGEEYRCNEYQLDRLYDGIDPIDLDLERIDDDTPEPVVWQHYLRLGL